jgi:hypothetical protein
MNMNASSTFNFHIDVQTYMYWTKEICDDD